MRFTMRLMVRRGFPGSYQAVNCRPRITDRNMSAKPAPTSCLLDFSFVPQSLSSARSRAESDRCKDPGS